MAFDSYGALYAADTSGGVVKFTSYGHWTTLASNLPVAHSMAIEPSGTIYLASDKSAMLTQLPPNGAVAPYQVPGVTLASVVTVDNYGNLSVGDNANQLLTFNDRTTLPYAFGNVAVGSSSTIHQSVVNVGNQNGMTFNSINGDGRFTVDAASTNCIPGSTSLLAGATCDVGITFTPDGLHEFNNSGYVSIPLPTSYFSATDASLPFTGTGVNSVPVPNTGGPYNGTAGTAVSFSGLASTDAKGEALTYAWSFGDNSMATGATPTHTYTTTGTYTVTLTVTNADGVANSAKTTATIANTYTASLTPASYDFGGVAIGSFVTTVFTLANTGTGSFSVGTVQLAVDNTSSYSAANTCTTLAAGSSCMITVTFKPSGAGRSNHVDDQGCRRNPDRLDHRIRRHAVSSAQPPPR